MQTRSALIPRPAIHADDMAAPEPKVSIVIPNRDGATPRDGLVVPGDGDGTRSRSRASGTSR